MGEALAVQLSDRALHAASAGSHPKPLHPNAVRVMRARGIDLAHRQLDRVAGGFQPAGTSSSPAGVWLRWTVRFS